MQCRHNFLVSWDGIGGGHGIKTGVIYGIDKNGELRKIPIYKARGDYIFLVI